LSGFDNRDVLHRYRKRNFLRICKRMANLRLVARLNALDAATASSTSGQANVRIGAASM
jgi:hypothetical protein